MTTTYVPVGLCGTRGERVVHVLDPEDHERHLGRLRDAGLDVEPARGTRQLHVRGASHTYVLPRYRDVVICTYHADKLGAAIAMDILRTQPLLIIGGLLQDKPYSAPPDDFLRELELRGRLVAPTGE